MKKNLVFLVSVIVGFTVVAARAQPGAPPAPSFDGAIGKLFGDNSGFTATMEFHFTRPSGEEMTMTGRMAHLEGKARFEMDLSAMQGGHMPPQAAEQMKQMGMSKMVSLTRRDKSLTYLLYPDMKAYVVMALQGTNTPMSEYKAETSKLGEETIGGHDCIKNKVVVTGPDGFAHESTVWNATDLKQFPVKIQTTSKEGQSMVMLFKEVKLEKPDDTQFDPPADFKKYDDVMSLMMSRARGAPPQ
jgi:hypothetical protein